LLEEFMAVARLARVIPEIVCVIVRQ
jgi:hypothetical protein